MFNTLLVDPMFNLLALIYSVLPVHDFGLSIIILTILIRLLLWPLVSKQLHSQRALQDLQPEMAKIRAETKGDKTVEGQRIMELYKEREINPFASILPLLIQLPIFFALYIVLKDSTKAGEFAKIAYEPIRQLGPIAEIIRAKSGFHPELLGLVDLSKAAPVLAALAALAQFIQTKQLQPKSQDSSNDPQAQMMKTMVYIFPFITFFVGLSLPSALALYWVTSSAMAILQQTLVLRRDVEELEEAIVVDNSGISKTKQKKRAKAGKAGKGARE